MGATAHDPAGETLAAVAGEQDLPAWRRRRRLPVAGLLAVVAVMLPATDEFSGGGSSRGGVSDSEYPTSTQMVVRESISQQTQVSATLGYAGDLTIRLPSGNAPAIVTRAQQTVTTARGVLATAQSVLWRDASVLAQALATVAADQQQERVDCGGDNAVAGPPTGGAGGSSDASGACAGDAQRLAASQQSVAAETATVAADRGLAGSAQRALAAAQSGLGTVDAQATEYGSNSVFTSIPWPGEIARRGQPLYSIDGAPVLLLYGPTVATRAFVPGMSPGADVAELNANLDALGYARRLAGDALTAATVAAIRGLQAAHNEPQTGELPLGSVLFEPRPVRVTSVMPNVAVGSSVVAGPVLSATWTSPQVSIQLDAGLEGQVKVGDPVTITLPDDHTTPGRISYVGTVASNGQNGATIQVNAVPTDPAATGGLDRAPVSVAITTASVADVLVVPVDALLARASGGDAVEEVGAKGRHDLVVVRTGLFDDADGLVQVSGSGLAAGQRVVVPGL